jgi:hypothetical protein
MDASINNRHFFTKSCHRQPYQNYEQHPQRLQNSDFQSHFLASKIHGIFLIFFSVKNIRLGVKLLQIKMFENFDFKALHCLKMCPIFVGSVHNFGRSDDDMV